MKLRKLDKSWSDPCRRFPARVVFTLTATRGFFVDIIPDRNAIARHGLTMRDVQDVIESAIGGMPIEVTVEGRDRFTINVRYPRELRQDIERLKQIEVPLPTSGSTTSGGMSSVGTSPLPYESPLLASTNSDFDYQVLNSTRLYAQMDNMGGTSEGGSSKPTGSTGTTGSGSSAGSSLPGSGKARRPHFRKAGRRCRWGRLPTSKSQVGRR